MGNTEKVALEKIKKVAVHVQNIIVARVTLHQIKQDRDEPIRSVAAKLKGQASICNYTIKHKCQCSLESEINYADEIVKDVLVSGLADNQIQRELFANPNQEMPLEDMINLIESKEVGNRSVSQVANTVKTYAVRSTYKRDINKTIKNHNQTNRDENISTRSKTWPCDWCGKQGHGNYRDPEIRRKSCPAFNKICKKCSRKGHYESACKAGQHRTSTIYMEHEDHSSDPEVLMGAVHHRAYAQGQ